MDGNSLLDLAKMNFESDLMSALFHNSDISDPITDLDLNYQDLDGKSALHHAIETCKEPSLLLLLPAVFDFFLSFF